MVLAAIVKELAKLFLDIRDLHSQVLRLIEAIYVHFAFLKGLDNRLLRHQLKTSTINLLH